MADLPRTLSTLSKKDPEKRICTAEVFSVRQLTHDVKEIGLALIDPPELHFIAGQYITIEVTEYKDGQPRRNNRPYSIASAPEEKGTLRLCVDRVGEGPGSTYLHSLKEGDTMQFFSPMGYFTMKHEKSDHPLLFVATGTGIAPIKSMIQHVLLQGLASPPPQAKLVEPPLQRSHPLAGLNLQGTAKPPPQAKPENSGSPKALPLGCSAASPSTRGPQKASLFGVDHSHSLAGLNPDQGLGGIESHLPPLIRLYWGLRREEDLFYQDEFAQWARLYPTFTFMTTLSKPSSAWPGMRGRVTEHLSKAALGDVNRLEAYLCGHGEMIKEVRAMLLARGVPQKQIHFEKFY